MADDQTTTAEPTAEEISEQKAVRLAKRERLIAELLRGWDELVGKRRAIEKREGRMAVELDIHANTCSLHGRTENFA
jgi:hypothetical protein